jgi:hypothetical protein
MVGIPEDLPGLHAIIDERIALALIPVNARLGALESDLADLATDVSTLQDSTAALDSSINLLIVTLISLIGALNSLLVGLSNTIVSLNVLSASYEMAVNILDFFVRKLDLNRPDRESWKDIVPL